jgi:aryl sulfotransferase
LLKKCFQLGASIYQEKETIVEKERQRPKTYKTWINDSTRWAYYHPRVGDIVIATYPKCGTTWMQQIVSLLVFQSPEPRPIHDLSPWIDCRFMHPVEVMQGIIEGQQHRRFLKSHLPFDGFPQYDQVRYIHVARDGRDACMSFFNHCSAFTAFAYETFDRGAEEMGPIPRTPNDLRTFWRNWLTKGVMPGATDGFPDLSFFDLETTYWRARQAHNLLLVHYNDLKADLDGEMRRIAEFLEIAPPREIWPSLVEAATFEAMKRNGNVILAGAEKIFEGGSDRFLFKGTNGRWRDVLTADDLALYEQAAKRLTPGLAHWLQGGRLVAGDPRTASD